MNRKNKVEMLGLFGIGSFLILVALFLDPIGLSPDSGIIDLGPGGTRWLLFAFGLIFMVGGFVTLAKSKK